MLFKNLRRRLTKKGSALIQKIHINFNNATEGQSSGSVLNSDGSTTALYGGSTVISAAGNTGKGLAITANGQRADTPHNVKHNCNGVFSIKFKYKPFALTAIWRTVFGKGDCWFGFLGSRAYLHGEYGYLASSIDFTGVIVANAWNTIEVSRDALNNIYFEVNGVRIKAATSVINVFFIPGNTASLLLGATVTDGYSSPAGGHIDDFEISSLN